MMPTPLTRMRDLPEAERPRERLLSLGSAALADAELLAVLLRTGCRGASALELARSLLAESGGLAGLLHLSAQRFRRRGLGGAKAANLMAAVEVGRRLARLELPEREPLDAPDALVRHLALRYSAPGQEVMGVLFLDSSRRLFAERELFRGSLCRVAVDPRTVVKEAILRDATAIVIFHTHPSGDPAPSLEDRLFTRRLAQCCSLLEIALLDHFIIGSPQRWISMRDLGDIPRAGSERSAAAG